MEPEEIVHLYIKGEGGYQKIVQRAEKYVLISNEAGLAEFLSEEDLKDIVLSSEMEYNSLEEILASFPPRKIKAIKEGEIFAAQISDTLMKLL